MVGIAEPRRERLFVALGQLSGIEIGAGAIGRGEGEPADYPGAATPGADNRKTKPDAGRRVLGEPGRHLVGPELATLDLEP